MLDVLKETITGIGVNYRRAGGIDTAGEVVVVVINILTGVTFALSIVMMAYSFFLFVVSAGDKDAVKKAKTSLTWSVVVLLLCFFVIALKKIFFALLGVNPTFNSENFEY
jgi:peptidoglycan biosynthesis protein MviN/MurJ (putative lipid II flippase)